VSETAVEREKLAARLRNTRIYLSIKQVVAAKHAGVHPAEMCVIEKGERSVKATELAKLARLYGTTTDKLLEGI